MAVDDGEYNESEEEDRVKFAEQLSAVGELGRMLPEHSVGVLARLLEERVCRLHAALQDQQHSQLQDINEDLHWLLLIAS